MYRKVEDIINRHKPIIHFNNRNSWPNFILPVHSPHIPFAFFFARTCESKLKTLFHLEYFQVYFNRG